MPLAVVIAEAAERDLQSIWVYVAERNYDAADQLLDEILAVTEKLAEWPEMGRLRPELQPGIRSFPIGNYVLFYRVRRDAIEVARVLHGRRDIDSLF
jgi:toxin ParE1/3/4